MSVSILSVHVVMIRRSRDDMDGHQLQRSGVNSSAENEALPRFSLIALSPPFPAACTSLSSRFMGNVFHFVILRLVCILFPY